MSSATTPPRFKVLFCGEEFPAGCRLTRQELAGDAGIEVVSCSREAVADQVADADVLVPLMCRMDEPLLLAAKRAKLVIQYGVGLEGVDIDAATRARIPVSNIPAEKTGNGASCAEHMIYLILAMLRDQTGMDQAVRGRLLGQPLGRALIGSNVLIVGFGALGSELAVRLAPFGVTLTAVRRSPWEAPPTGAAAALHHMAHTQQLLALLPAADVVVLTCTMNASTAGMVGREFLAAMKPEAILVNAARGGLLQYEPVKVALESGRLGGLATDVMWSEPCDPDDPLVLHPRVIVTPHVAGVTDVSYATMAKVLAAEVRRLHAGHAPSRQLNPFP